jgi:hypothetical protein
MERNA